jgi:hypothetical protein
MGKTDHSLPHFDFVDTASAWHTSEIFFSCLGWWYQEWSATKRCCKTALDCLLLFEECLAAKSMLVMVLLNMVVTIAIFFHPAYDSELWLSLIQIGTLTYILHWFVNISWQLLQLYPMGDLPVTSCCACHINIFGAQQMHDSHNSILIEHVFATSEYCY